MNDLEIAAADLRQELSHMEDERNERQRGLKELTAQYDKESEQISQVQLLSD